MRKTTSLGTALLALVVTLALAPTAAHATITTQPVSATVAVTGTVTNPTSSIVYKNYDGTDLVITDPTYPTTYDEGFGVVLPTLAPSGWMPGYDFLGFWDCPLDPNSTVAIPGRTERSLDLSVGNQVAAIPSYATGDVTVYLRADSPTFDDDVNGGELGVFAPPGVFPAGTLATMRVLNSGTPEYKAALAEIDQPNIGWNKIADITVFDSGGNKIQPNTFFGSAVIAFGLPIDVYPPSLSLFSVVVGGQDIKLNGSLVVGSDPAQRFLTAPVDHFSLFAVVEMLTKTNYKVLEDFGMWEGSGVAVGKVDGPYSKFVRLTLAGKTVDPANYTVTEGSTVITLHQGYLKTLANGVYLFRAEYTDGFADLTLTVNVPASAKVPLTGDNASQAWWWGTLLVAAYGTLGLLMRRQRWRRHGVW